MKIKHLFITIIVVFVQSIYSSRIPKSGGKPAPSKIVAIVVPSPKPNYSSPELDFDPNDIY